MNTVKFLLSAAAIVFAASSFGQTSQVTFSNDAAVWQKTDKGSVSTFTFQADSDALALIKERYDGLGQSVAYEISSVNENTHTISMTFDQEISPIYLNKMLIFIGCQTVVVGEDTMTLEEFTNYLSK